MYFSDSQGRHVANAVIPKDADNKNLNIFNLTQPGAKFNEVTEGSIQLCLNLGKEDAAVFIAGANDVARNEISALV